MTSGELGWLAAAGWRSRRRSAGRSRPQAWEPSRRAPRCCPSPALKRRD